MMQGYYRFPTIHEQTIVFVCEDDLWTVSSNGGMARRLTSGLGESSCPFLSPDGKYLAFTGREEGVAEVYCMPATGGVAKRLTFLGTMSKVVGWSADGKSIIFASNYGQPFDRNFVLFSINIERGLPEKLPYGSAMNISYNKGGKIVIGRNTADPARWKRYRGGRTGNLWVDIKGKGEFKRLINVKGNLASPMWIGERIYFISDHEGVGNIYSCLETGKDLKKHTKYSDFYVRNASTDKAKIVYHAGADIYVYDPATDFDKKINIEFYSPQTQRNRKFVDSAKYLDSYDIHIKGHSLVLTTRGKFFTMGNWEGAVRQYGIHQGVRYRLARWLYNGEKLIAITDEDKEEIIQIFSDDKSEKLSKIEIGKVINVKMSPKKEQMLLSNHRCELIFIDLNKKAKKVIDKSEYDKITDFNWSPDGEWVVYSWANTLQTACIKLWHVKTGKSYEITDPVLHDVSPCFDPDGKYIYFLSYRIFDPVHDNMHFDLNFPRGVIPCLITLQKDTLSPFIPIPKPFEEDKKKDKDEKRDDKKKKEKEDIKIDIDGIKCRVISFPVPEARYRQIYGIKDKVLILSFPIEGAIKEKWFPEEPESKGKLEVYNFNDRKLETIITGITDFKVSQDKTTLVYRSGRKLRVIKAGDKPDEKFALNPPDRKSGWIDLNRIKVSINPVDEWKQMYREAWVLQKENFWRKDMSGVDWNSVYKKYLPLLDRIATRSEFSDLIWEMQGELGTSHAYEIGGDYRKHPYYCQGFLGVDFEYDSQKDGYSIKHIVKGDCWNENDSPLNGPGINVKQGQILTGINGYKLNKVLTPYELLVNQGGYEVFLNFLDKRTITVKTLKTETPARYREWVNKNREYVYKATNNKVGYIHIPDMGPVGFAEFHRAFLSEITKEGLIVDVRYNGGGNVSQLLLEKLARKRIAYDVNRWCKPCPYPNESPVGPMVAITNEDAGSDGDIFSHSFKLMNLGPLIGKRTWGGVIGISPRHALVDGTITTQPEFSFWFKDVGWKVENYGTEPDIEVEITPQDYVKGKDPQLDRAIEEIMKLLKKHNPKLPEKK